MRTDMAAARAPRVEFLGVAFDPLDLQGALGWLAGREADDRFAYVVTPNVDHMIRLEAADAALRAAYADAALCLNDSRILGRLARREGVALPVAPGSDLTPALLAQARPGDRIALVGGTVAEADALARLFPRLEIARIDAPMGLARDPAARSTVAQAIARDRARFFLLALGSPQQELIAAEVAAIGGARGTALCIGASVEFLLGTRSRAPRFVQRLSLEWAWRLAAEPRKLWRRYLLEAPRVFPMVRRWRQARRRSARVGPPNTG